MLPEMTHPKPVFPLFGSFSRIPRDVAVCLVVLSITLNWGCGGQPGGDGDRLASYGERSGAVLAPDAGGVVEAEQSARGWSVLVAMVPSGRADDADRMLGTVRAAGLAGAVVSERDGRPVVVYGSYDDPGSEEAQAGLAEVRGVEVAGMRPFATAVLLPPPAMKAATGPDSYDLRGVKAKLGDKAVYTLQVGVYGRPDFERPTDEELKLFREQAELAVQQLRGDGEQAFYYHGPNTSSVTIGVFSEDDYDATTMPAVETPALRALRKRFPNNLLNGEGLMETVKTDRGPVKRLQASRLVAIPKK